MVVKAKEKFERTRHTKDNDKSKRYTLPGQRNVRYYDRILSSKKKSYNFTRKYTWKQNFTKILLANFLIY